MDYAVLDAPGKSHLIYKTSEELENGTQTVNLICQW